jgi:V/A-type H+-transporting ATPase subunit C
MLISLSTNVVLAKARTMYGRRLTQADYNELLKCRTVGEVAGYLKNHTVYGGALAGIVENEIHRGELESRLRQKLMEDYAALCKYEVQVDRHFSRSFIERDEIRFLLLAVLRINSGKTEAGEYFFPPYLLRKTVLDLSALARAKTVDDLKNVIEKTPYEKLMAPFLTEANQRIDYTALENALNCHLFSNIVETISKHFIGKPKKELLAIYQAYLDLNNYVRIVRLRVKYGVSPEDTKKSLLPSGAFPENFLDKMANGSTEEEIRSVLEQTEVGRKALKMRHVYLDEIPARMNFQLCRHYINYSINPPVVLIAFIFLSETEIGNIITIIEGKRYQLAPEEIKKLLIFEKSNLAASAHDVRARG